MNTHLFDQYLSIEVTTFMLVFMRILGLFMFAPIFSARVLPVTIRFYLVIAAAFLLSRGVPTAAVDVSATMVGLVLVMVGELLVGLILGTFVQFMFLALQLAGQTSGTQLGLALASVINPQFDDQSSTTSVIYATIASLIFFATGLDRELFRVVFDTFEVIPPGQVFASESVVDFALALFSQAMIFSVRVAAPVVLALFLAELAMGFIGRTVPQLNVMSVGFSIRITLGLMITMAGIGEVGQMFCSYVGDAIVEASSAIAELAPAGI